MTLTFVILSSELTLFNKNFEDFIKYNCSEVTLIKNYIHTQYDAGNINGYELTVENSFRWLSAHVFKANEHITGAICIIHIICVIYYFLLHLVIYITI